jgi:hypothetical protein
MSKPYGAIASTVLSLTEVAYHICDAWASAPGVCSRASRQLGSVNLALRRFGEKPGSEGGDSRTPLARNVDPRRADLTELLGWLAEPLNKLDHLVTRYKMSGRGAWARILMGGMVKRDIETCVSEIQFHMAALQVLSLSLLDERFSRLDYHLRRIFDEEQRDDHSYTH